jgi:hypothetical protein
MWAEWVAAEIVQPGVTVVLRPVDRGSEATETPADVTTAGRVIVLLSADYAETPQAADFWRDAVDNEVKTGLSIVQIRLDDGPLRSPFSDRPAIDLSALSEDAARSAVHDACDFMGAPDQGDLSSPRRGRPRFPASHPAVWNVPDRNRGFTGRGAVLDQLREHLAAGPTAIIPTAHGETAGTGKTQLAQEYAHRFGPDYEAVWWISAEQRMAAGHGLVELAACIGIDTGLPSLLAALSEGRPFRHWLLVFDHVEAPADLRGLVPQGSGHVLFTSRHRSWPDDVTAVTLDGFTRSESVMFLRRLLPGLDDEAAALLAEELGDLPSALARAATWMRSTDIDARGYLALLTSGQG